MMKLIKKKGKELKKLAVFAFLLMNSQLFALANESNLEEEGKKFSPAEMIMHHIKDAHEFHLWADLSIPLPIILYTPKGIDVFMSTGFYKNNGIVTTNKGTYKMSHEKIYYTNNDKGEKNEGLLLDFSITKNVFSLFISLILISCIFIFIASRYKKRGKMAPKGIQSFFEPIIIFIRDEVVIPNIGEKKYALYLPYILTLFFFIWFNNMIGLVPFFPGSANLSGNISFTFTLSLFTFLIVQFSANKAYWRHIFWMKGVPTPVRFLLAPIELLGTVSKAFALMIRLFANITGGHIVVLSLVSMIFMFKMYAVGGIVTPFILFIMILELMVAAVQAYVFALLTSLFIGMAVAEDDHH